MQHILQKTESGEGENQDVLPEGSYLGLDEAKEQLTADCSCNLLAIKIERIDNWCHLAVTGLLKRG